ncbi:type II/IV secretion system ATPase subunit [Methanolobus profundi]|uniref:Flagellar protein FlaI n=1 Tax=Methanolobus profundi TaxID=487685 RepID=A0A1I4PGQ2_9EURY|nr:type II/IV secretion system ATPase subunit [Methanolobus profundi]SFM26755.1 flagellar protein FlaI [Methanolobus profundi]
MKTIFNKFNSSVMQMLSSANIPEKPAVLKGISGRLSKNNDELLLELPETPDDLVSFSLPAHMEEIDRYWVDEPYCFICILYNTLKKNMNYYLIEPKLNKFEKTLLQEFNNIMGDRLTISNMDDGLELDSIDRYELLRENTKHILTEYFDLQTRTFEKIYYYLKRDFIDFGTISAIMKDPNIEDVWCNGVGIPIFVYHKTYGNIRTNVVFSNDEELDHFVTLIAQQSSRHLSRSTPILDTIMRDGSRINITYGHDISPKGSSFSIRRQKKVPLTPLDLIAWKTFSSEMMAYFWFCMEHGKSILFCGGTATGKTSSLNAVCLFIPIHIRIVTLEDTQEINLPHKNWISTITREGISVNKMGTIDLEDLLRASLRQRPEYLLVGEVRGRESQTLFQAMNAGHATCSTFHAGTPREVINRFTNPPLNVPPAMFSALDIISMQSNIYEGGIEKRKASHISEVTDVTSHIELQDTFLWDPVADSFEFMGSRVLQDIKNKLGWTEEQINKELGRRAMFLDLMLEKNIRDYNQFIQSIHAYSKDPDKVIQLLVSGEQ